MVYLNERSFAYDTVAAKKGVPTRSSLPGSAQIQTLQTLIPNELSCQVSGSILLTISPLYKISMEVVFDL
jgi:hypothetical protein